MVPSKPILATPGMMDPRGHTMSSTCMQYHGQQTLTCMKFIQLKLG
jgi:hypothetical protein